jgi:hypothetical protein
MAASDATRPGFSLRRWSERKLAASRAAVPVAPDDAAPAVAHVESPATAVVAPDTAAPAPVPPASAPLPAVESLTFDSDFAAFLKPEVDESMRRGALRKLFRDPRFNVMDGLDIYIDDYGKPDPISPEIVRQLVQGRYLFDPPRTRVNARGEVEDVPPESAAATPAAGPPAATAVDPACAALPAPVDAAVPACTAGAGGVAPFAGAAEPPADPAHPTARGGVDGDPGREGGR